jgi:hypothetical protein
MLLLNNKLLTFFPLPTLIYFPHIKVIIKLFYYLPIHGIIIYFILQTIT